MAPDGRPEAVTEVLIEERVREHADHDRQQGKPDNGLHLEEVDERAPGHADLHDYVIARLPPCERPLTFSVRPGLEP